MAFQVASPVRIARAGNPLWPLPPDYNLRHKEPEYQRVARVNAASLWRMPGATAAEAVASWSFFRRYYLLPDPEQSFDPAFFFPPLLPPAAFHYHLVGWQHQFDYVAIGAPRFSGKSASKQILIIQRLVTGDRFRINNVVSKEDLGVTEGHYIRNQIETNERLLQDFGELRSPRGSGIWNNHGLILRNGCEYSLLSIEGKKRGKRGSLTVVDDVEFDDDYITRSSSTLARLKSDILKVIVPMGGEGAKLIILGTMVSKQSLLYQIVCTENDSRFTSIQKGGLWFKLNIPAIDAEGNNAWPEKYTPEFIATKRRMMGESFFRTEFMGDPRSEEDSPFNIVPVKHEYRLSTPNHLDQNVSPYENTTTISYNHVGEDNRVKAITKPLVSVLAPQTKILTVDYAEGLTTANDYSAIVVSGLDRSNDVWVWDAWHGRCRVLQLAERIWKLASKWRVNMIAVESVATQIEVFRVIREYLTGRAAGGWLPTLIPLKYPAHLSKADRIAALEWRFNYGKIRGPAFDQLRGPQLASLRELWTQIRNFTPDLRGLPNDDVIDALAMFQYVVRGASRNPEKAQKVMTPLDHVARGETYVPGTTIAWGTFIDPASLTIDQVHSMLASWAKRQQNLADQSQDTETPAWILSQMDREGNPLSEILL